MFWNGLERDALIAWIGRAVIVLAEPDRERDAVSLWESVAGATGTRPKVAAGRADSTEEGDFGTVERHRVRRGTIRYAHPRISATPVQISCHRRCSDSS